MTKLKKLNGQVMVITGATSGIGLATAYLAAERGARLVLASRNEDALRRLTEKLNAQGREAVYVVADVGCEADVQAVRRTARERFGGFDTWVNNAGTGVYGRLSEVAIEDHRQLFETNFWGVVYGSLEAARHLRVRGGTLINVGSALSDRAIPLQGMYATSKHAVKGFTDALRMELEAEGAPVNVTLVKPASIDTPFPQHAKNYMREEPTLPPPVYAPEVVAEAILHCATRYERELTVGGGGKLISALGQHAPRFTDKVMESDMFLGLQKTGRTARHARGEPSASASALATHGQYGGHVRKSSFYTLANRQPLAKLTLVAAAGLALAALLTSSAGRNK